MKREEAVAGRWIQSNLSDSRRRLVGETLSGDIVVELPSGATALFKPEWLHQWDLLPAECDSFDWQPETFPQWYASRQRPEVAFIKRTSKDSCLAVLRDGHECKPREWEPQDKERKQITEAEALALLDKPFPVESPDDWVTQDRVPVRVGADEVAWFWHDKQKLGPWNISKGMWDNSQHGNKYTNATLHVRCRRKCLPPLPEPEPVKPGMRKVVLTEWLIEVKYTDHSEFRVCLSTNKPIGAWVNPIAIGTREIELPL
jgi:hypothetical protein